MTSAVNVTFECDGNNTNIDLHQRGVVETVVNTILLTLIILTTLVGNVFVIYAVLGSNSLRTQCSNFFIINLSITDMSNAVIVMSTSWFTIVTNAQQVAALWCNICCMANYCFIIVSMLTLSFISIDRYIAILYSLKYPMIVTNKLILALIAYAWFQGIVFASAPAIMDWVVYDYWEAICAIAWHKQQSQAIYYVTSAFILCFMLPGIIMLFSYVYIMNEAKKIGCTIQMGTLRDAASQSNGTTVIVQNSQAKKAAKTIRSLLVVVALFFVCMTPFCVTKLLKVIYIDPSFVPDYVNLASSYFQFCSSVVNPFIYGIFRSDFRHSYKRILRQIPFFKKRISSENDRYNTTESMNFES